MKGQSNNPVEEKTTIVVSQTEFQLKVKKVEFKQCANCSENNSANCSENNSANCSENDKKNSQKE